MGYPDLGDWNGRKPNEAEDAAVATAEAIAWTAIEQLTAGRVVFEPVTVRPMALDTDGTILLERPVGGVVSVKVGGVAVNSWRLDDGARLQSLDPNGWTANDDLTLDADDAGVLEVTYFRGWRPGRLLVWAAGQLAFEFYKAAAGDRSCRLPPGVTSVARQGVNITVQRPLFQDGQTGISEVDIVLARYNPNGLSSPTIVASPESLARARRVS